jgi:hypothetical protein
MKTLCPHCNKPIDAGAILAARARGVKKHFSPEEIAKRTARLLANRHTPSRRRPAV